MISITEEINKLEEEISNKSLEINKLKSLSELFPDIEIYVGRWKKIVHCSPSVNKLVTDYECRYNCGCCFDSPLEIWTYINTDFGRVYSKPAMFFIGEKGYSGGDVPDSGWKDQLRKYNIPEHIITKVELRFNEDEDNDEY